LEDIMSLETRSDKRTLSLSPEAIHVAGPSLSLYEAAMPQNALTLGRVLKAVWTAGGLVGLIVLAWCEPWSAKFFAAARGWGWNGVLIDYALNPLIMALRGVLGVEAFGYAYHRFFQHLGFFTRKSLMFRRNQKFHWMHHMIIYPIGRFYKRPGGYVSSEGGLGLSWLVPAFIGAAAAFAVNGVHAATFVFVAAIGLYAYFIIDDIHSRFHLLKHSYLGSRYYAWLEKIHILHHWDQRMNFTIVYPFMDVLFGTYISPATHEREIEAALADEELTVSDLINWRYLLKIATPAEYAAFISQARKHPRSLRKIGHLMEVYHHRMTHHPEDKEVRELKQRAADLLNAVQA